MEKFLFKILSYELIERITRLGLLLDELEQSGPPLDTAKGFTAGRGIPTLLTVLRQRLQALEATLLNKQTLLTSLLSDNGNKQNGTHPDKAPHSPPANWEQFKALSPVYAELNNLSQVLLKLAPDNFLSEGHLFLKDTLPEELQLKSGHLTVFLEQENTTGTVDEAIRLMGFEQQEVLLASISVLQKQNPLGWLSALRPFGLMLAQNQPGFVPVRALFKQALREFRLLDNYPGLSDADEDSLFHDVVSHAIALRLCGPAYYFYTVTDSLLKELIPSQASGLFLSMTEPALFYGLNHFSFSYNALVILHEGVERIRKDSPVSVTTLNDPTFLSELFRMVEKTLPDPFAFTIRHFERAIALKERLADQGTLISSASVFSVENIANTLAHQREQGTFAIYELLTMMTEQPHSPREIVNAGWLSKIDRIPVWLFTALQQDTPFSYLTELTAAQDHLLCKSIETSEVHRVLLCHPNPGHPNPGQPASVSLSGGV